jgi:hypothetical protein
MFPTGLSARTPHNKNIHRRALPRLIDVIAAAAPVRAVIASCHSLLAGDGQAIRIGVLEQGGRSDR